MLFAEVTKRLPPSHLLTEATFVVNGDIRICHRHGRIGPSHRKGCSMPSSNKAAGNDRFLMPSQRGSGPNDTFAGIGSDRNNLNPPG
eukprot:scaffold686_cov292-Chaetoceros_neogracile.AAC.6